MRNTILLITINICSLLISSCKHELPNQTESLIPMIVEVEISDSVIITHPELKNIQPKLTPNIGIYRNNYYVAPSSIHENNTMLKLEFNLNNQPIQTSVLIKRGNKKDSALVFNKHILPILVGNCNFSGCHGNGSRAGRVSLENFDSTFKFVNRYQPMNSLLYLSLIKSDPLRRMPPAGPMNNGRVEMIYKWIEQGAYP